MGRYALLALALVGCGWRSQLPEGTAPARRDAGVDAATGTDAGRDDAGLDAGMMMLGCRRAADCSPLACRADPIATPADLAPLALICGERSPGFGPGQRCEGADECGLGICLLAGSCTMPCATDADCDAGDHCRPVYARTSDSTLQPLDGCVAIVDGDGLDVARHSAAGALVGPGSRVELFREEPALFVIEAAPQQILTMTTLATGGGLVLFDLFALGPGVPPPPPINPPNPVGQVLTVLVPNGPRSMVFPEGLVATIDPERPGGIDVTVLTRPRPGRLLAVDIFHVGGAEAAPRGMLERALAVFTAQLAAAGIEMGELREHRVIGALLDRYSVIESETSGDHLVFPELPELFALSAGAGRASLAVFLVRLIDGAVGVAGAVPGPQGMHGTAASGIALSFELLGDPGFGLDAGRALTHEAGHFLGLFHTSEIDGTVIEPLPDSPECRIDHDIDGDGFLLSEECMGAGAENVMFWAASGDLLTPDQNRVIGSAFLLE